MKKSTLSLQKGKVRIFNSKIIHLTLTKYYDYRQMALFFRPNDSIELETCTMHPNNYNCKLLEYK